MAANLSWIDDMVQPNLAAQAPGWKEEQFINVGSGREVSIRDLTETVKQVVGYTGSITWDTTKPDGTPRKLMDSSRLFALGWRPQIDLETGIRRAYADFLARFGWC